MKAYHVYLEAERARGFRLEEPMFNVTVQTVGQNAILALMTVTAKNVGNLLAGEVASADLRLYNEKSAELRLLDELCTVALNEKVRDHLPFGCLERVHLYLAGKL